MKSTEELIERLRGWNVGREVDIDEVADRLEELSKERAEMVAALRCIRKVYLAAKFTLREVASMLGVSATTFSKWTATDPTTEPDFID